MRWERHCKQLEWVHQVNIYTDKPVLIVAPLGVTVQTAYEEAPLLGLWSTY